MIYFLQEDGGNLAIKIGYTSSDLPTGRQKGCQTGNSNEVIVLATMSGSQEEERVLHRRFASARLVGEWFRPVPELLQFMLSLPRPEAVVAADFYPYAIGMMVEHASYGVGSVSRLTGVGPTRVITIRFPTSGEQRFRLSHVKLSLVNEEMVG